MHPLKNIVGSRILSETPPAVAFSPLISHPHYVCSHIDFQPSCCLVVSLLPHQTRSLPRLPASSPARPHLPKYIDCTASSSDWRATRTSMWCMWSRYVRLRLARWSHRENEMKSVCTHTISYNDPFFFTRSISAVVHKETPATRSKFGSRMSAIFLQFLALFYVPHVLSDTHLF